MGSASTKPRKHPHSYFHRVNWLTSQLKSTSILNKTRLNTVANQPAPPALSRQLPLSLPPSARSAKLVLAAPLRRDSSSLMVNQWLFDGN
jgi:hypothetical protein